MSTITIPRTLGGTLILSPAPAPTVPTLVVVATFRDGCATATYRDGRQPARHRDGIAQSGGR